MFTLIINHQTMEFKDYSTAIGTFFTVVGTSVLQKETKNFELYLNNRLIREVVLSNGLVILDRKGLTTQA